MLQKVCNAFFVAVTHNCKVDNNIITKQYNQNNIGYRSFVIWTFIIFTMNNVSVANAINMCLI